MAAAAQRPYQIVVWGASGFTGKLVCEHIARDYIKPGVAPLRWAMAGRDKAKLESVREELARTINPAIKDVPILTAEASDKAAVGSLLSQTQVVLALVGPFSKYGNTVLEQAVQQGTTYCDITGEVPWVKQSILKYHQQATDKKVKIVHCCGFDSIPSDLGALLMAEYAQRVLNRKLDRVTGLYTCKGGASGGTIASGMHIVETVPMSELISINSDAYYLAPGTKPGTDRPSSNAPILVKDANNTWAGPWIMEGCNARIVHRSNAIRAQGPYGPDFKWSEHLEAGQGWSGWLSANMISMGTALIGIGFALAPARAILKKLLPAPGQGPSLEAQRTGSWRVRMVGVTAEPDGGKPTVFRGECGDSRDPGYWSTSRMILETGLALVLDADAVAKSGCLPGGVLTPATAAGEVLIRRLRAAGFTFKVEGDTEGQQQQQAVGGATAAAGASR